MSQYSAARPVKRWSGLRLKLAPFLAAALGRTEAGDHAGRRLTGIIQGVVTALGNKAIGILVSFLSVPLTIGYLGAERYGVWIALGSLLAWLQLVDLGIANGLTNAVTTAIGKDREDLARNYISSALAMLTAISLVTGGVVLVAAQWIDWNELLGVHSAIARAEVKPAITLAFLIFLVQFPLTVIGKIFLAYQEGKRANYWGAAGNLLSLVALIAVTQTEGGLPVLVLAVSGTYLFVTILSALWLFMRHRPSIAPRRSSVRRDAIREIGGTGMMFFLIQILALLVFQTDNLIIAHYLGAAQVTPYSVTYKLFGYTSIVQTLLFSYVWVAFAEAIARKDIAWVGRTFHRNLVLGTGTTILAAVPLIFVATPFIRWWAGPEAVPPFELLVWMAAWSVINAFCGSIAALLAAASHMKAQLIYSAFGATTSIALSVLLVGSWGLTGVIAGTVVGYIVAICVPAIIDAELLLRRLRREA